MRYPAYIHSKQNFIFPHIHVLLSIYLLSIIVVQHYFSGQKSTAFTDAVKEPKQDILLSIKPWETGEDVLNGQAYLCEHSIPQWRAGRGGGAGGHGSSSEGL